MALSEFPGIVRELFRAGIRVDAYEGLYRLTPLTASMAKAAVRSL